MYIPVHVDFLEVPVPVDLGFSLVFEARSLAH